MTVFYRKYRPQKLADLTGQGEIAKTLLAQLESGKVGHGYLFWGPKGTGKTSTARILAKALNCEKYGLPVARDQRPDGELTVNHSKFGEPCNKCSNCLAISDGSFIDLIEIDAASNRGIDEVRDLREKVKLAPALGRYKVYIIDEVHMLTPEAFNALLKTLEEPPKHVIFVLATTEYAKLPPTIVSRLMKFNFARATKDDLVVALTKVAKAEKIKIDDAAIMAIAEAADGSFRDAVSILDQVSSTQAEVKREDVVKLVRLGGWDRVVRLVELISQDQLKEAVMLVDETGELGLDVSLFVRQTVVMLEQLLHIKIGFGDSDLDLSGIDIETARKLAQKFTLADLQKLIRLLVVADSEIKVYPLPHIPVVMAVCKYCDEAKPVKFVDAGEVAEVKIHKKPIERSGQADVEKMTVDGQDSDKLTEEVVQNPKPSPASTIEVEKSWGEFLNRVRPMNAHVFALLRATKPVSWESGLVTLEVFYRFHKDKLEEPKISKMLDGQMAEVLGNKVRLKFVLAQKGSRPTSTVIKSDVVEARGDDLERMANEIFSK